MENVYELLFLVGAIGFTAMTALSFVGSHHQGGQHGHGGHGGHQGPTGEMVSHARISGARSGARIGARGVRGRFGKGVFSLSPLDIFAYALGFGATGILARPLHLAFELPLAILGALVLNHALIKPLIGFLLRFASNPSEGLEGAVAREAEAITGFDARGQGLVSLVVDGESVQVLARLQPGESGHVRKGDRVVVLDVDPVKNQLTVTRELA